MILNPIISCCIICVRASLGKPAPSSETWKNHKIGSVFNWNFDCRDKKHTAKWKKLFAMRTQNFRRLTWIGWSQWTFKSPNNSCRLDRAKSPTYLFLKQRKPEITMANTAFQSRYKMSRTWCLIQCKPLADYHLSSQAGRSRILQLQCQKWRLCWRCHGRCNREWGIGSSLEPSPTQWSCEALDDPHRSSRHSQLKIPISRWKRLLPLLWHCSTPVQSL